MATMVFGGEKEEICTMCCDMGWLHLMAAPTLYWGRCPSTSKRRLEELHKLTNPNGRSWLPLLEILKLKPHSSQKMSVLQEESVCFYCPFYIPVQILNNLIHFFLIFSAYFFCPP